PRILLRVLGVLGGILVAALAGWVVWSTLEGDQEPPELWELKVTAAQQLAPDRFVYSEALTIEACGLKPSPGPVCVGAMDRSGVWLGEVRALKPEGECWTQTVSAAELSDAHYGPLWLVVVSGLKACTQWAPLVEATRGQGQPRAALGAAIEEHGWVWGTTRIYIHDKLQ
ncbi:MAG: hypothetical protein AAFX99_01055, partial [Myxococcota bacterium]